MTAVMQPPVRSIALPAEVCEMIVEMQSAERTGHITIHMLRGEILTAEIRDMRQISKPTKAT